MKIADKVALILDEYGFSLAEGLKIYEQFEASEDGELVHVDSEKDCVVCLKGNPEESKDLWITVWLNYVGDFCLNYNLVGAVAMHDSELDFTEEDTKKFLVFFPRRATTRTKKTKIHPNCPNCPTIWRGFLNMPSSTITWRVQVTR